MFNSINRSNDLYAGMVALRQVSTGKLVMLLLPSYLGIFYGVKAEISSVVGITDSWTQEQNLLSFKFVLRIASAPRALHQ